MSIDDEQVEGVAHFCYNFPDQLHSGLRAMATKFPFNFANFIGENDDAETADVFIQCCLFGGLRYG